MANRQFTGVVDSIRDIAPDENFADELAAEVEGCRLVTQLMALRGVRGLSQADIAERMQCSQGCVSKIENAKRDDDIRLGRLREYAAAVGHDLGIGVVPKDLRLVDKVKCLAFGIKQQMEELAELANTDDEVADGVAGFFYEAMWNFMTLIGRAAKRLPNGPSGKPRFSLELQQRAANTGDSGEEFPDGNRPISAEPSAAERMFGTHGSETGTQLT